MGTLLRLLRRPLIVGVKVPKAPPAASLSAAPFTPGRTRRRVIGSRPRDCRFWIWLFEMSEEFSPLAVCTWIACASTVTAWVTSPNWRTTEPRERLSLAVRTIPGCSVVRKPAASTLNRYVPGTNAVNTKFPVSFAIAVRVTEVFSFCKVTVAPGTIADDGSTIVPLICAEVVCATHGATKATTNNADARNSRVVLLMVLSSTGGVSRFVLEHTFLLRNVYVVVRGVNYKKV